MVRRLLPCLSLLVVSASAAAQQSAQLWDAPVLVVPDPQQRMNELLDLNGDGWTDAVGTYFQKNDLAGVYGFLNDGNGRLMPLFEFTWGQSGNNGMAFPIESADLNGDGNDDFIACVRDQFEVFLSNGAAAPTRIHHVWTGSGYEVQDLVLGDFDGDGEIEAAVRLRTSGGIDRGVRIYDDLLSGPSASAYLLPPSPAGYIMKAADADGDGRCDLMLVGSHVRFLHLDDLGALVELASFAPSLGQETMGATGDVDGDGDEDAVVWNTAGSYCVLRRTGVDSYSMEPAALGGPATDLADVDGDGDLDGVCCGGGGGGTSVYTNWVASQFEIALNDGTGAFAASFRIPSLGANEIAGVDDLDQDGDVDLIAGRIVFYNKDGIRSVEVVDLGEPVGSEAIRDVDGDGDPDVQLEVATFRANRGDGVLSSRSRRAPAPPPGTEFVGPGIQGDLDGDGDVDVIVRVEQNGSFLHERLLWNTGGGGLVDGGLALPPGVPFHPDGTSGDERLADVDGDGLPELVVGSYFPGGETRVFALTPAGYVPTVTLPGENTRATGDLDGDGADDLVTVSTTDLGIRWGDPGGALTASSTWSGGSFWTAAYAAVADLDGDGDLDVVGPRAEPGSSSEGVRVLENLGGRSFTVHDDLFPEYVGALLPLFVEDLDADGDLDVLLGQRNDYPAVSGGTISGTTIFLGSSVPFDFTPAGAETHPLIWALADLDGDGDPEAISNGKLYENRSRDEATGGVRLQYGRATRGQGGQAPTLGMVGPFDTPRDVELRLTGAAPGVPGVLLMGEGTRTLGLAQFEATLPIFPILWRKPFVAASATGEWGSGSFAYTVHVPLAMAGRTIHHQAILFDPAGPGGVTVSNVVKATYVP